MASASSDTEAKAFVRWMQGIGARDPFVSKQVDSIDDLCDGVALFEILTRIDDDHFRNPHGTDELKDNIVVRIGTLKRLYKLIIQYVTENLHLSVRGLEEPDLDALARIAAASELCKLCRLILCISVQSNSKMTYIEAIQSLSQEDQQQLMQAIEETMKTLKAEEEEGTAPVSQSHDRSSSGDSVEKSPTKARNGELATAHSKLIAEHEAQQAAMEAMEADLVRLQAKVDETAAQLEVERRNASGPEQRSELQRVTQELRKCEEALAIAEAEIESLQQESKERNRSMEVTQQKAKEYDELKDQLDEYKHAAEKLQKAESVIDKYKKKLEEGADLRRKIKELEDQNAELIDRNTSLQDEQAKVNNFKPLMDSYKTQVAELESKSSNLQKQLDTSNFENKRLAERLEISEQTRATDKEELELYQERVRELELGGSRAPQNGQANAAAKEGDAGESLSASVDDSVGLDEELEDALSGTSMTDLKIQLRRMKRERDAAVANKADVSRILVLENLLEDSQRLKARYEADYLQEHQASLLLNRQLEDIRSGKSNIGDGPEANVALRSRLNEIVDELDQTKKEAVALRVEHESVSKELTLAKSDLTLVNRDQLDVLRELRASVDKEKSGLESDTSRLRSELQEAKERNHMLVEQVNGLLLDKVNLQTQSIGHRDEALRRERNLGELRASLAGKALPKEAEDLIHALQTSHSNSEAQAKSLQDKLTKARAFIRQQDQLLKDRASAEGAASEGALQQELRLMASAYQDVTLRLAQELHSAARGRRNTPFRTSSSWLSQQRQAAAARLV